MQDKYTLTEDGSITYWNKDFKEHYHIKAGARLEAEKKYIIPSKIEEKLLNKEVNLIDICFGLGYNSLCAVNKAIELNQRIKVTALEIDLEIIKKASKNIKINEKDLFDWKDCLKSLIEKKTYINKNIQIDLIIDDARKSILKLKQNHYDFVFLDAFSTQKNTELWTLDFFNKIKKIIKEDGVLLTYCAAIPVRKALLEAGFYVGETSPIERDRGGTIASLSNEKIKINLPQSDLELFETTRGFTYRDPNNNLTSKEIQKERQNRILEFRNKANLSG